MNAPAKVLRYGELDRDVVTDAALRISERDGVDGLTLRSLAVELGLSHTALYHHVRNKQEVIDLLTERVLSDVEVPAEGPWPDRLRAFAHSARRSMLRAKGIAQALQTQPMGGAAVRVDSVVKQLVIDAGVPAGQRESAHLLLTVFIVGSVTLEQAIDGLPHRLRMSATRRFDQGLDLIIAGFQGQR